MPRPAHSHNPSASTRRGFSLIELLVVITIMLSITFMLVPAATGVLRSYSLEATSQSVINQLSLARQTAATQGREVEVRFYLLPGYDKAANSTPAVYRGMQCFVESDTTSGSATASTSLTPITKPVYFSSPVNLLNNTVYSTLLTLTNSTAERSLPPYQLNYSYVAFHFKPNGQTDLPDNANCLTLVLQNDPVSSVGIPNNFRTIEINPHNSALRTFQP